MDYLFPDVKLIVERDGPDHYIKPAGEKHAISEYREKVLKKIGYDVILVPTMGPEIQNANMSSDLYLFDQLNKYLD